MNDPRQDREEKENTLVSELFKLLDTWERQRRRRKLSEESAEGVAGVSFDNEKRVN